MIIKTDEISLHNALAKANVKYNGNLRFTKCQKIRQARDKTPIWRVRLGIIDSKQNIGTRKGFHNDRRISAACCHAHGDFFDALLKLNINACIWSGRKKIDKNGGNWEDRNVGSMMNPHMFSEMCFCDIGEEDNENRVLGVDISPLMKGGE